MMYTVAHDAQQVVKHAVQQLYNKSKYMEFGFKITLQCRSFVACTRPTENDSDRPIAAVHRNAMRRKEMLWVKRAYSVTTLPMCGPLLEICRPTNIHILCSNSINFAITLRGLFPAPGSWKLELEVGG